MKTTGIALAGLLATASIGLAACSSGGKADSAPPANNGGTGQTTGAPIQAPTTSGTETAGDAGSDTSSSDTSGGGASMPTGKACQLVTVDQVAAATGHKIGPPQDATGDTLRDTCTWQFTDSDHQSSVSLVVGNKASDASSNETVNMLRTHGKKIDGLGLPAFGIEAYDEDNGAGLVVDGGSWAMILGADDGSESTRLTLAQLTPIAKAALSH
jgi:hypothetical protein